MRFSPERAAIRFGCGLSPSLASPADVAGMLDAVRAADHAAAQFPIPGIADILPEIGQVRALTAQIKKAKSEEARETARKARRKQIVSVRVSAMGWLRQTMLRRITTEDGFRERLAFFWGDHFTAHGKGFARNMVYMPYLEDAIRPHLAGRFADMLKAVVTHPVMLGYLDQNRSIGPGSVAADRRKTGAGLNENLAREVLELHTLGVDGPYTQDDVRQLAELLTGLTFNIKQGFRFQPNYVEPGPEMVLGRSYGGGKAKLSHIFQAMEDLAQHPATARHIAQKLAVHFVSDTPNDGLIAAMEARYFQSGGNLAEVYGVLLDHPAAWQDGPGNVKQPVDFIGSSLRALDLVPRHIPSRPKQIRRYLLDPLELMGQRYGLPGGPDGWPEADAAWITPQRMAARLQWAMTVPFALRKLLPDPRDFLQMALGESAPEPLKFAANAAETKAEGVALILSSPAFHRM